MTYKVFEFVTSKHTSEWLYGFLSFSNTSFGLDQGLSAKSEPPFPSSGTFVNVRRHFLLSQQQDTMSIAWVEARDAAKHPTVDRKPYIAQQTLIQPTVSITPHREAVVYTVWGLPFCTNTCILCLHSESAIRRTRRRDAPWVWLSFCFRFFTSILRASIVLLVSSAASPEPA